MILRVSRRRITFTLAQELALHIQSTYSCKTIEDAIDARNNQLKEAGEKTLRKSTASNEDSAKATNALKLAESYLKLEGFQGLPMPSPDMDTNELFPVLREELVPQEDQEDDENPSDMDGVPLEP